jgi:alpha-1,6-mannosyltransferase
MHVVDATLFFSPTSGGVKRYLLAKHEWMREHTNWRHSLVVPGESPSHSPGDISTVAGGRVPGAFNYRLPLNPLRWSRAIEALEPDLIEVGDVFHPAWAAARVARRRGIPLVAFYHSNFPQLAGRRLGPAVQRLIEWYVRRTYERCEIVLAPSRHTCDYLHSIGVTHATCQPLGVDVDTFHPQRRGRDLLGELGLPRDTRLLAYAGRFSAEKNIPVLLDALRRLGARYHLLLIGGDEARREGNVTRIPYCRDNRQLASYLASVDAFVRAGVHQTRGQGVLEAKS